MDSSSPRESASSGLNGKGGGERGEEQARGSPPGKRGSEMRDEFGVYDGVVGRNYSDPGSVDWFERLRSPADVSSWMLEISSGGIYPNKGSGSPWIGDGGGGPGRGDHGLSSLRARETNTSSLGAAASTY
ncbi:hypothetical protein PUN28_011839 [Cardiocondyla obscurior]|uniref:Uncharacterized protein n=1 Tax=Cardiocondyla obscurior TaxID=286306 RepID=A0AAW2FG32_9HYME